MLERALEDTLRASVRTTAVGAFLSISDRVARPILEQIKRALAAAPQARSVVLASMDVRRHVRNLLIRNDLDVPVLSYQELAPEFNVQPLVTITGDPEKETLDAVVQERLEPSGPDADQHTPRRMIGRTAVGVP